MRCILPAIAVLIVCWSTLSADIFILRDGTTIEGTVIDEDWQSLLVKTTRAQTRIEKNDIQLIRKPAETIVPRANSELQPLKPVANEHSLTPLFSFGDESTIKISFDARGTHTATAKLSDGRVNASTVTANSVDQGWEIAAEYTFYSRWAGLGGGAALQLPRTTTFNAGTLYFAPVYLVAKLRTPPTAHGFFVYAAMHGGYNFLLGDTAYKGANGTLTGGLYYGYGCGAALGAFRVEILRTVNKGILENSGYTFSNSGYTQYILTNEIEYTKTSVSIIYSF
ncbi:MAG: hypothetical protein NTU66_00110 [Elusimicrobia bacterium]|nr:hypothetical protein [Elusimicrobiota bacterium]